MYDNRFEGGPAFFKLAGNPAFLDNGSVNGRVLEGAAIEAFYRLLISLILLLLATAVFDWAIHSNSVLNKLFIVY